MSALEKAARALAASFFEEERLEDPSSFRGYTSPEDYASDCWGAWVPQARAVLMAVQDLPMSLLEEAAKSAFGAEPLPHEVMNFDSAWTACLDQILSQPETLKGEGE